MSVNSTVVADGVMQIPKWWSSPAGYEELQERAHT